MRRQKDVSLCSPILLRHAHCRRVVLRDTELYVAALKARKDGGPPTQTLLFPEGKSSFVHLWPSLLVAQPQLLNHAGCP